MFWYRLVILILVSWRGPGDNEGQGHDPEQPDDGDHDGEGVVQSLVLDEHLMAGDLQLVTRAGVGSDVSRDVLLKLTLLHNKVSCAMSEKVNVTRIIRVLYEEV